MEKYYQRNSLQINNAAHDQTFTSALSILFAISRLVTHYQGNENPSAHRTGQDINTSCKDGAVATLVANVHSWQLCTGSAVNCFF